MQRGVSSLQEARRTLNQTVETEVRALDGEVERLRLQLLSSASHVARLGKEEEERHQELQSFLNHCVDILGDLA